MSVNITRQPRGRTVFLTNECLNPSFEVDQSYWVSNGFGAGGAGTYDRITGANWTFSGPSALRQTWTTQSTAPDGAGFAYKGLRWDAGVTKFISGYMYSSNVNNYQVFIYWKDGNGATLGTDQGPITTRGGTWTRVGKNFTAPAGTYQADVYFIIKNAQNYMSASDWLGLDGVLFQTLGAGSNQASYFDGSTAANGDFTYQWTGTAHLSASQVLVSDPASTITPFLAEGNDWTTPARSSAITLYSGKVAAVTMASSLRTGVHRFFFLDRASAVACERQHRVAGVWDYTDTRQPEAAMRYVVTGGVHAFSDAGRKRWRVEVPFAEITP